MNRTIHIILFLLFSVSLLMAQQGVLMPKSYPGPYRPIFDEFPMGSPLTSSRPDLIDTITPKFAKDTLMVDFEGRRVTYSRFDTLSGLPLWEFHFAEMNDYLKSMEKQSRHALWKSIMIEKGKVKSKGGPLVRIELPAHLPAWATRILGKKPPQLSITGSQKIKVGYKKVTQEVDGQEVPGGSDGSIMFEPTSNFVIRGSIGRLLKIEIKLSGATGGEMFESVNDQLSNIKML